MIKRGVMVKQISLQSDTELNFEDSTFVFNNFDIQRTPASLQVDEIVELDDTVPRWTFLNLENLKCFETVEQQYKQYGVVFSNCIAIEPSNPAFPKNSGTLVLMGAPKGGFLEATFLQPVQSVSAVVTSSQRLVLSAYDGDCQLLSQAVLSGANLANSDSTVPPNTLISVSAKNIHTVTFCAFDGQFTVDDFSFSF
ncbi:MAG: hypothetical protein PUP91_22340 [Rhizonema sp. PD37]|nr:hypothetical protein [Rhizonema sp. PD37]